MKTVRLERCWCNDYMWSGRYHVSAWCGCAAENAVRRAAADARRVSIRVVRVRTRRPHFRVRFTRNGCAVVNKTVICRQVARRLRRLLGRGGAFRFEPARRVKGGR